MDVLFGYIERLIVCISPIICAWMAWKSNETQKKTKEFMELQAKYNKQVEENKAIVEKDREKQLEAMHSDIEKLQKDVNKLSEAFDSDGIHKQLSNLLKISKINFDYSTSLSQVICAMGDCIERSTVGDISEMKTEFQRHKTVEASVSSELLKLVE